MFGEDDSESLRASSPWDPFLSSSPEAASLEKDQPLCQSIPKLMPEVEEGNVEYKLKLTDIPPARFARLVTQLKWRLLEGSGQAYYELGVADSGALIGLSRLDLEQSLETLEMMAGEIGASVIVVKEIEVPPAMVALADKVSEYIDPETGEWTDKMVNKRSRGLPHWDLDMESTDASSTDIDIEDPPSDIPTPADISDPSTTFVKSGHLLTSNPERPTAQSSPFIAALDDDLALFSMEPEPAFTIDSSDEPLPEHVADHSVLTDTTSSLNIEISSVYKPRPVRRRIVPSASGSCASARKGIKIKAKEKRPHPWHQSPPNATSASDDGLSIPNRQETRALQRRLARDKRREEKRMASATVAATGSVVVDHGPILGAESETPIGPILEDEATELVVGMNRLAVDVEPSQAVASSVESDSVLADAIDITQRGLRIPMKASHRSTGPRLIVEAMVVRKMSIEDAFLDFGGFSLM